MGESHYEDLSFPFPDIEFVEQSSDIQRVVACYLVNSQVNHLFHIMLFVDSPYVYAHVVVMSVSDPFAVEAQYSLVVVDSGYALSFYL